MTDVAILVFDGVDLLDVGGPYEVFLTADRLAVRAGLEHRFSVHLVGPTIDPITAYGGMVITPAKPASSVDAVDLAVLPGAIDIDRVVSDDSIMAAARHLAEAAATATSVCTGAFLLGSLGRLDGLRWTTHFEDVDALAQRLGSDQGTAMVTWVNTGDVVTSGGLSSGIAMALHLVERYATRDLAVATARQLEYAWNPDAGIETRSATIPRNASLEGP